MQMMINIFLFCCLLVVDVHGQYYLLFRFPYYYGNTDLYPNDQIMCIGYDLSERSIAQIVIRQLLNNGTWIELSSCPLIWKTECDAKLVKDECGRVNLTCSVVRNETEEENITREIFITDKASIESFHIHYKGLNNDNATQIFPSGSLIKLVCRGDVSVVNDDVFENITLSWRNGTLLKTQDPPIIKTTRNSDEPCKSDQIVSAFLYLKEEQLDAEITCNSIWYRRFFSERGIHWKSIRIKTVPEINQMLGPVVVYKDESEDRSLLSLMCETTTDLYNSTDVNDIKWCIRKANNTHYNPLILQEDPHVETFNRSKEKTLKSSVLYQLLKREENVEIICETNHSNTCGSGTLRGTVRFNPHPFETTNFLQNDTCVTCANSNQPNTLIYASSGVMIASIIILISGVAAFYKAKERVKHETSNSSLNVAAADKIKMPKANTYNSIKNNPISEVYQNEISSGGQTYSNTQVQPGGATIGVYDSTEAGGEDFYEPVEVPHDEPHVYEGKHQTAELYEDV